MTLRELQHKFRTDTISTAELEELRRLMDAATDAELGDALAEDWDNFHVMANAADVEEVRAAVARRIAVLRRQRIIWRVAAAVVLLVAGCWLGSMLQTSSASDRYTDIATAAGGRTSVSLPDGTVVDIDANSCVRYCTTDYGQEERRISFVGRAFFEVAKNPDKPFVIEADGIEVRVLGTSFNLDAEASGNTVSLTLESGKVALSGTSGSTPVEILPGQEAIVDRRTGEVVIKDDVRRDIATAWRRNELVFDCAGFADVCASFMRTYGVTIEIGDGARIDDTFSGTLPTDNVIEAVDIICRAYGLKSDFYTTGRVVLKK